MTDVWSQLHQLEADAEVARLAVREALGTPDLPLRIPEYRRAMDALCALRIKLRRAVGKTAHEAQVRRPLELRT